LAASVLTRLSSHSVSDLVKLDVSQYCIRQSPFSQITATAETQGCVSASGYLFSDGCYRSRNLLSMLANGQKNHRRKTRPDVYPVPELLQQFCLGSLLSTRLVWCFLAVAVGVRHTTPSSRRSLQQSKLVSDFGRLIAVARSTTGGTQKSQAWACRMAALRDRYPEAELPIIYLLPPKGAQ